MVHSTTTKLSSELKADPESGCDVNLRGNPGGRQVTEAASILFFAFIAVISRPSIAIYCTGHRGGFLSAVSLGARLGCWVAACCPGHGATELSVWREFSKYGLA